MTVSRIGSWTIDSGNEPSGTVTIGVGSNRKLDFIVAAENNGDFTVNTFTIGGQAASQTANAFLDNATQDQIVKRFIWDESAIAAMSGSAISYAASATPSSIKFYYATFAGCDQADSTHTTASDLSTDSLAVTTTSTANDFISLAGCRSAVARDFTNWDTLTEHYDLAESESFRGGLADGAGGDNATTVVGDGTSDDMLLSVMVHAAASTPTTVTRVGSWTIDSGNEPSGTVTIGAGSNRKLDFIVAAENNGDFTVNTFTIGGQAASQTANAFLDNATQDQIIKRFVWNESAIAAMSGSTISYAASTTPSSIKFYYATYAGCDQADSVHTTASDLSTDSLAITTTSTANDFISLAGCRSAVARDFTNWDTLAEHYDLAESESFRGGLADGAGGDNTTTVTGDGTSDDMLLSTMVHAAASTANNPPTIVGTPAPVFTQGTAAEYDLDQHMNDQDGDQLLAILNTGTVALPAGVTLRSQLNNNALVYDGVGAAATTVGHTLTADDSTDTSSPSASFDIEIQAATDRAASAGIYLAFAGATDPNIDLSVVAGRYIRANLTNYVPNGDYDIPANFNPSTLNNRWNNAQNAIGGPKYGQISIIGKKDPNWQKHFWFAENASALGAPNFENPKTPEVERWIGAWWDEDTGSDAIRGIHDLGFQYFDDVMTQAQRDLTIGIRVNIAGIASEGDRPGNTLDDTSVKVGDPPEFAYVKGSDAGSSRPQDYTSTLRDTLLAGMFNRVLDKAFPVSDDNDPLYPILFRPKYRNYSTQLGNRCDALWAANKLGIVITNGDFQPRSSVVAQHITARDLCKKEDGNTQFFIEMFGDKPNDSDIDGQFSTLQQKYWEGLEALHIGGTWIAYRPAYLSNYNLTGNNTLRDEWRAIFDFVEKYAGYQQFPGASPGAWVALREGIRLNGNYDFLATQVITGAGNRGTELYCGSDGTSFTDSRNDFVGLPSDKSDQSSDSGTGQRQSIWAYEFTTGQHLKIALDATFAQSINGQNIRVNVHYLDNSASGVFEVNVFGNAEATVNVNATNDWLISQTTINSAAVSTDADGAHIDIDVTTGPVRFHMVEVEKL